MSQATGSRAASRGPSGGNAAPSVPSEMRADVPVQAKKLEGKDYFINNFPASIPQRASHWFSKTRPGKWLHKAFRRTKKSAPFDENRRDLNHAHKRLLKGAGPSMFERLFHRGRAKRYDALVGHIKDYHADKHHSPEKLQEVMDHIEAWKGRGEGSSKRMQSVSSAGAYIGDLQKIAKSDRAKRNWGKTKIIRHDIRRKNERASELKHMRMQRAAASMNELTQRSPFGDSSGLSDDDKDRQAMLSHPLATGFDDVESRQESVTSAAKRIGTKKYDQLKKRYENIHDSLSDAVSGGGTSPEDAQELLPNMDTIQEGGQSAMDGMQNVANGDFSALSDVTDALGAVGGEATKLLNVKKQAKAVRDHGMATYQAAKTANKAGAIKSKYNDAGHSLFSPRARLREVRELAAAKNAVNDKGQGNRGTAWIAKQLFFGHNDRSKKHTIERHAEERSESQEMDTLMAGKAQGAAILGDLASNVQSQYARERNREALNTVSATADLLDAPLALATAGASSGFTKGIKGGAQLANVVGGTGEKLIRERNNRNAAHTLQNSGSQGDKALSARQLLRNDLGAADKVFGALTAKVDHKGRSLDIHHDLASEDPQKRQEALDYLKSQRGNGEKRFNLNDQIRSAQGLAGVAQNVKRSEDARQRLIRDHGDEIHALHEDHKDARTFDSFDHNLGLDDTAYDSDEN